MGGRPGTRDLDGDAPIGLQAGDDLRAPAADAFAWLGDGLRDASAFGAHALGLDALADQIRFDRFGAVFGEDLVVGFGSQAIGVADGADHPKGRALEPAYEVIQRGAALGAQLMGVESEQRAGIRSLFRSRFRARAAAT